ncbi:MAG: heterodisulfide reductase-related iron-sulfur binding cluster [Parahaliea sp.]
MTDVRDRWRPAPSYHDSCAGLRELGIRRQPRELLQRCTGTMLAEMADTDVCCGCGGTFCVKCGNVSARMADDKLDNALYPGPVGAVLSPLLRGYPQDDRCSGVGRSPEPGNCPAS